MRSLLIFLFIVFSNANAVGSELKSVEDVEELVADVISLVGKGDPSGAMALFKPHLVIPQSEFSVALEKLALQQPMLDQRFGETIGAEKIGDEEYGKSFLKITFLQRFDRHAMRWRLWFYRSSDRWVLSTFQTDDLVQNWF
jgi:hypothetical protein